MLSMKLTNKKIPNKYTSHPFPSQMYHALTCKTFVLLEIKLRIHPGKKWFPQISVMITTWTKYQDVNIAFISGKRMHSLKASFYQFKPLPAPEKISLHSV